MTAFLHASDLSDANPAGSAWELLWILFVLAVVVALIVLLLRFLGRRSRGWGQSRSLRSLGGYPLGTNKSLQIVEWNGRIYVLGVGENVTLLDSITDPELAAALLAEHDTFAETAGPFLPEWLRKRVLRKQPLEESAGHTDRRTDRPSFKQTLEERLRQLAERRRRAEQLLEEKPPEDRSDRL